MRERSDLSRRSDLDTTRSVGLLQRAFMVFSLLSGLTLMGCAGPPRIDAGIMISHAVNPHAGRFKSPCRYYRCLQAGQACRAIPLHGTTPQQRAMEQCDRNHECDVDPDRSPYGTCVDVRGKDWSRFEAIYIRRNHSKSAKEPE